MEPLYYQSPYVKEFEAEVVFCREGKKGYEIALTQTGFYPEGGGQPSDTGYLGSVRVKEVHEKDGQILHYTDEPLTPGEKVAGRIDWEERYSNMQQHSGEHIVSGLIHRYYGYDNVGFHMGKDEVTIDLSGVLTWDQLMEIEREANEIVYENLPVCVTYPSQEELQTIDYRSKKELTGQVRIVEMPKADICACCGTHVERTGEIGVIKFLSVIHYKGGVRISMLCGKKALEDYERKTDQETRISNLLSAKPDKLAEAVERLKQENSEKDIRLAELTRRYLELRAEQLGSGRPDAGQQVPGQQESGEECLLVFEDGLTPVQVRQFCNLLVEQGKGKIVAVCSGSDEAGYSYCVGSRERDMKQLGKALNSLLNGRGGGSAQMVQGTFFASGKEIQECFDRKDTLWN